MSGWNLVSIGRRMRSVFRGAVRYLSGPRGHRRVDGFRLFYKVRTQMVLRGRRIGALVSEAVRREVRIFVDGKKAFRRIEKLIRSARSSVVIQMFIWKDDETGRRIAQIIVDAADRGVVVDITKEAVGDFFERGLDFLETKFEKSELWSRFWNHKNIRIHYRDAHDHAKVYVIDDRTILLTGMNIADEYRHVMHDYLVELRGRAFVEQYLTTAPPRPSDPVTLVMNRGERRDIRPQVMQLINGAQKSIVLEHCYLSDDAVLDALIRKSREGVRVTVILPRVVGLHHHANMKSVGRLLADARQASLQIFIYPRIFHGKIMLIDRSIAFLGSANMMRSSLDTMGEVNVLIGPGNGEIIRELREILRQDTLKSRPLVGLPPFRWLSRWLAVLGL